MRRTLTAVVALSIAASLLTAQRLQVSDTPEIVLGADATGSREMFGVVYGATRLPDGNILVADAGDFGLRVFSTSGRLVRQYGRKGQGPGELTALMQMLRCGDTLITRERLSHKISVFTLDGRFIRSFRFGSREAHRPPYRTTCSADATMLHLGWYDDAELRQGLVRSTVPYWLSKLDSVPGAVIARRPGDEMQGRVVPGRMRGSSQPLIGRRSVAAITRDRIYIGSGDSYEIGVYDLAGKPLGTIRKMVTPVAVTAADVAAVKQRRLSLVSDKERPAYERELAEFEIARFIPPYESLVVDSEGLVWVRDYPRATEQLARWSVFTSMGAANAEVQLPASLEVYEIGKDYVLGRYLDPDESVPQVRLYRLRRGP
jgi:hypothetical protein